MDGSEATATGRGYTLVYTGDGKGKTTASIGLAVRAAGQGLNVLMLQFIKSPERISGEHIALRKLGVDIRTLGAGFTWKGTPDMHRAALQEAWNTAKEQVLSGSWDMVILDEINNALAINRFPVADVLPLDEVLELIAQRPRRLHLVLTGRSACPEIIAAADLVTEMQPVKHYYQDGVAAVQGLEY